MRRIAAAIVLALLTAAPALAQPYPRAPRPAGAGAVARDREIHERFRRAVAAEERRDWTTAASELRRVLELDPPEPRGSSARYDLALAEAGLGHDERAAELLREALRRDPHFAAAASNLVTLELRRGDVPAARAAADSFAAIAPRSLRAHYARGLAALRGGDLRTARIEFSDLTGHEPSFAAAHYDLALVELRDGRDEAARIELERALALAPGYARARFALGTVLLRGGRRADARTAFEQAARDAADPALKALAQDLRDRL